MSVRSPDKPYLFCDAQKLDTLQVDQALEKPVDATKNFRYKETIKTKHDMTPKKKRAERNRTAAFSGPEFATIEDAVVRIPGRSAELMRLAMMHEPACVGVSFKAMAGTLCRLWAEDIIAKRRVHLPEHLKA